MKITLRQLIPQAFCLKCKGCCRFLDKKSQWIPKISASEILKARKVGISSLLFSKVPENGYRLKLVSAKEINLCAGLSAKTNKCRIYHHRPFDCQLYPFILTSRNKKIFLSLHLACPFVKEHLESKGFNNYLKYLKGFLNKNDVLLFIRENIFLAQGYADHQHEIMPIFSLDKIG